MKKWILRILKVLGVFIALYLVVALVAPSSYKVEKEVSINADSEVVFDLISKFENWEDWSVWKEKDSTVVFTVDGEDGTIGCIQSWVGDPKLSGKGNITVTDLVANEKFAYDLKMIDYGTESKGALSIVENESDLTVKWEDSGDFPFMMRPIMMFMDIENKVGNDLQKGLANLDSVAQIKQHEVDANRYKLVEMQVEEMQFFGRRKELKLEDVDSAFIAKSFGIIVGQMMESGAEFAGMPGNINFNYSPGDEKVDVMPVIPVDDASKLLMVGKNRVEAKVIPAGLAVVIDFYGEYEDMELAHRQAAIYLEDNNLNASMSLEQFVSDPTEVESMDECLTKIYYFLE